MATNDTGRRLKVFLCHANEDKPNVREVYNRLQGLGFDPWMDDERLSPGAAWKAEIETRIQECDMAILFLSAAFVRKRTFVQKERELIIRKAEGITVGGTNFLIPAILGDVKIPKRLAQRLAKWQFLKMGEEHWDAKLMAVLRAREEDFGIQAGARTGTADPVLPPRKPQKVRSEPRSSRGQETGAPVIVFVPGFFGTALSYRDSARGIRERVWSTDGTALVKTLQDNPEWLERTTELEVGEVLTAVHFGWEQSFPLYEQLFDAIWSLGYDRGQDFQPFGYDWRLSIKTNADKLADFLQNLPQGRPVKIIAHSMGGLVVRYMLAHHRDQDVSRTVQSVIQIATPVLGSSRAYYALKESARFGDLCEWMRLRMEEIHKGSFDLLKKAMNGFESVMELLPHDDNKILKTEGGVFYSALHPGAWPNVEKARLQGIQDVQSTLREDGLPSVTAIYSVDIKTDHIYNVDNAFKRIVGHLSSDGDGVALKISAKHGSVSEMPIEARATHYVLPSHPQVLDIVKKEISRGTGLLDQNRAV